MGCSLSLHHKVTDSSPKLGQNIEFLENAQTLVKHFDEIKSVQKSKKLVKCIFIFGGSGSSKGEFIWDLMQRHAKEEEELNQVNLRRFVLHPDEDPKELSEEKERKRFKFSYIDIEKLVAKNIKKRIQELVRESNNHHGHRLYVSKDVDIESSSSSCEQCESQEDEGDDEEEEEEENEKNPSPRREDDMKIEKIKPYLTEFANVVTCNWILRLVESEIKRRLKKSNVRCSSSSSASSHQSAPGRIRRFSRHRIGSFVGSDEPETIFLVNLLPNRINLFKKCLYLNQTPNLNHAQFDYFAINLTRVENEKKKDLDVVTSGTSFLDETNNTFVKYFRSLNKLVEFRIKVPDDNSVYNSTDQNLTIKLTHKFNEKNITTIHDVDQLKIFLNESLSTMQDNKSGTMNKVILVNADKFDRKVEEEMFSGTAKLKSDRKIKSPPSPLIFMVENKIELEDYKITIQLDESFCDTNSVRPFINCVRHILQETKEQKNI